jgi:hypothetical protein
VSSKFRRNLQDVGFQGEVAILDWKRTTNHFFTERANAYLDEIKKTAPNERILTIDCRDVLFQRDPRTICQSSLGLSFYLEDASKRIADCPYNSKWIVEGFGQEGLDRIGMNPISCAGTVLGLQVPMRNYYERMCAHLVPKPHVVDQGIHNWMIWTQEVIGDIIPNEQSDIYTVQYVNPLLISHHRIGNHNSQIPAIVHQFDRHLVAL